MSTRLKIYLVVVALAAIGLLAAFPPQDLDQRWAHYVGWILICVLSETMWSSTLSGEATWSLSSSAGLAAVVLWGQRPSMWIVAISTLLAEFFVLRKPWVRTTFNSCQIAITMWVASGVFALFGGPLEGLQSLSAVALGDATAVRLVGPVLGLFAAYLLVNRALVSVAVAWSSSRAYLKVLREDWFYYERLLEDMAAFFLSPLMVISFRAIGYPGVILFYVPLRMIYESEKRFVELHNAQKQLILSERMAAKGEMAAEIGHELNNQLVAIRARAQMLLKDAERQVYENVPRHTQIILDQSRRMEGLAKGLMDFSRAELKMEMVDLNALIQRTVEVVRAQNRFDDVEWDLRLASDVPPLHADPGQLHGMLLNLFFNAADAMAEKDSGQKRIVITSDLDERTRMVRLVVTDTGIGIAPANLSRVFEPHFTTKPEGHGFGLSTSYRIVTNHGGRITAESPPGRGASFTIMLPVQGPSVWT